MCAILRTFCVRLTGKPKHCLIRSTEPTIRIAELLAVSLYARNRLQSFFGKTDVVGLELPPLQSESSRLCLRIVASHHILYAFTFATQCRMSVYPTMNLIEIIIASPVLEELLFRGAVLQALLNRAPTHPRACLTMQAGLFGAQTSLHSASEGFILF